MKKNTHLLRDEPILCLLTEQSIITQPSGYHSNWSIYHLLNYSYMTDSERVHLWEFVLNRAVWAYLQFVIFSTIVQPTITAANKISEKDPSKWNTLTTHIHTNQNSSHRSQLVIVVQPSIKDNPDQYLYFLRDPFS